MSTIREAHGASPMHIDVNEVFGALCAKSTDVIRELGFVSNAEARRFVMARKHTMPVELQRELDWLNGKR